MINSNRCMALLAHVDTGKTTLSESILLNTGVIREAGRVDHGTSFLDTESEERDRGITIFSKQALFDIGDKHFTLIDTPGHVDFSAEMERALGILDFAVLIISAPDGVHGHDITLWKLLDTYKVPVFVFVNKMDQAGASREKVMKELNSRFGAGFVDFSGVFAEDGGRENVLEAAAVLDEALLEQYLEDGEIDDEQLRCLIQERKLFPCCFGSALKNDGVKELLDILSVYSADNEYPDEFGAKIYKISRDRKGNRLTHVRITGGVLRPKDIISVNCGTGENSEPVQEKVNRIISLSGTKAEQLNEAEAGMVVTIEGLEHSEAGGTLGAERRTAERLMVPLFTSNVSSEDEPDIHKLYLKLKVLEEEIPEIGISYNEAAGEIGMKLMGEVQTDIIKSLVKERYDINIDFSGSSIVYKETINAPVICAGHYEPLRHYAEVHLLMEPGERGSGIEIGTQMSEDVLPRHFQRLIMTNIGEKKHLGVLTGSELTDVRITLINARAHDKHTEGGDFRESVYRAVRYGLMKARAKGCTALLEPYYAFELRVPDANTGRAMTDLSSIAEHFEGPELIGGEAVFTGRAAVSAMQGYAAAVLAYTGGFGVLNVSFDGYGECLNADEVIGKAGYDPELDLENQSGSVFCAHGAGYYVPWYEADAFFHLDLRAEEIWLEKMTSEGSGSGKEKLDPASKKSASPADRIGGAGGAGTGISAGLGSGAGTGSGRGRNSQTKQDYMGAGLERDKELEDIFYRSLGGNRGKNAAKDEDRRERRPGSAMSKTIRGASGSSADASAEKIRLKDPKKNYLLVDGYNIIFAWDELRELAALNIDAARAALQDILANYQGYRGMTLILVFDAYKVRGGKGSVEKYHNIYVVYTMEAQTADAYIEKTVHEIGKKERVTVATSDRLEQTIVFGEGAARMSARELYEAVMEANADIRREFTSITNKLENRIESVE